MMSTAEKLEKWAKDMNYYVPGAPDGCHFPPSSHFKLLCKGKNAKVWDFVIDHFYTQSHVRKVKAMLALHSQKQPLKAGMDFEKELTRHQLQKQLIEKSAANRELKSRIALLESKVQTKEKSLLEKESQLGKMKEDISEEQRKISSIRQLKSMAQHKMDHYQQLEPKLRQLLQTWDRRKEGNDFFNILMSDNQRNAKLEKCAAALLDRIKSFLQNYFASTKSDCSLSKEAIWQEVEALVMGFPTHQLEAYLAFLSREQREALEAAQPPSCLELPEDAILPTCRDTHQVLLELHVQDQKRLTEALTLQTQIETVRSQVDNIKLQLCNKLKESSPDQWELQETYFAHRALQASWEHKLSVVKRYILECGPLAHRLEDLRMNLEDSLNETQELEDFLSQNISLLSRVFQHNKDILDKCSSLQAEVQQLTSEQLLEPPPQQSPVSGWVTGQLDHMTQPPVTVTLPGVTMPVPITKLTIHRHHLSSAFFPLDPVMEALGLPIYKSSDQLATAVYALSQELMNPLPQYHHQALPPAPSPELVTQRKAAEHKTSTILTSCRKPLDSQLSNMEDLNKLLEEWWNPPSWSIRLPQPVVEGRTLEQWMKNFAKAKAILIRQIN